MSDASRKKIVYIALNIFFIAYNVKIQLKSTVKSQRLDFLNICFIYVFSFYLRYPDICQ